MLGLSETWYKTKAQIKTQKVKDKAKPTDIHDRSESSNLIALLSFLL